MDPLLLADPIKEHTLSQSNQHLNMAKFLPHFLTLIIALRMAASEPILSCSQTPYPHSCTTLLDSNSQLAQHRPQVTQFRNSVVRATIDRTVLVHRLSSAMNLGLHNDNTKVAWADCLELWEDSISQLNRSMLSSSSSEDAQTWLSAALANQHACINGFNDLNSSFKLSSFPSEFNLILESISNLLAINKAMFGLGSEGVPNWVLVNDREFVEYASSSTIKVDLVVAKDGSGNYKTIREAVAAVAERRGGSSARFVIHVKAGVYRENVEIANSMKNIMMIGDGIDITVVTGSKNVHDGSTTFGSATFAVSGNGFIAQDMTFENTAGPQKHQAVALRSGSDLSVFYRCSFKGYQDTLYVHSQRQFYRNCDIYGTVDFIFGDATVVFQNCNIYVRKPMSNQKNTVTAQGRMDPNENTGIVIHNSVITTATDLKPVVGSFKTYLGRPWKKYSRTVFMKTTLDSLIDPAGWLEWSGDFALSTLYYGEYMNTGVGAGTSGRVKWPGYQAEMSTSKAGKFTVGSFLSGDSWIPYTQVPYTTGL